MLTSLLSRSRPMPRRSSQFVQIGCWLLLFKLLMLTTGCSSISTQDPQSDTAPAEGGSQAPSVDVAIVRRGFLKQDPLYVGTTFPVREVSLRSQLEGRVLNFKVDVGDRVEQGQILAQIDNSINQAAVLEARAELAALQAEVNSLRADADRASTQIERAEVSLQQAKSDLARSDRLFRAGAVSQQAAEQAQNTFDNAKQTLAAAQQQVANRSGAVEAAQRRVAAQQALVAQEQQRESFAVLTAPIAGYVLERILEPGDLARVGDELLQLGDFSQVKVRVQVSELELSKVKVGQTARVRLDALPEQTFAGEVTQISLAADATARLIPIEVTIPNRERQIGRGLLARVNLDRQNEATIIIPETAVAIAEDRSQNDERSTSMATLFLLQGEADEAKAVARRVELGDRADARVEVLTGLKPGEKLIVRSSENLQDGDRVRLSFLSEL